MEVYIKLISTFMFETTLYELIEKKNEWKCFCSTQKKKKTIRKPMVKYQHVLLLRKSTKTLSLLVFLVIHLTYLMAWAEESTIQKSSYLNVETLKCVSLMSFTLISSGWCWLKTGPSCKIWQKTWGKFLSTLTKLFLVLCFFCGGVVPKCTCLLMERFGFEPWLGILCWILSKTCYSHCTYTV